MLYKLRPIVKSKSKNVTGLTIPDEVALMFSGCYIEVKIMKINNQYGFFCGSHAMVEISDEEVNNYEFQDCRIKKEMVTDHGI